MQTRKKARLLTGVLVSVGLILTGVVAVAAPASAAPGTSNPSPGGATITVSNTDVLPGETVTVTGTGFGPSQHLYVSYCGNPPGGTNCQQKVGDYQDVYADASGNLAPTTLTIKNLLIKSASLSIDCRVANACTIGTSNADVPSDTTWNTVVPISMKSPNLSLSAASGPAGTAISVSGTNYPTGPGYRKLSAAPFMAATTVPGSLYVTQCAMTGTGPACATAGAAMATYQNSPAGAFNAVSFTPQRYISAVPPGPPGPAQNFDCATAGLCFIGTSDASDNANRAFDALSPFQITGVPAFTISSITGQAVTNAARGGDVINVSASNWTTAPTATVCDADGTSNCAAGDVSGTLTTSGGALTVAASPSATGARSLVLTDGTDTYKALITILGTPTLSLSPGSGGAGISVAVTGSNWNPTGTVAVSQGVGNLTANATGAISGTWTAAGTGTVTLTGTQGSLTASANFSVGADDCNAPCSLSEDIVLVLTGGNLSMAKVPGVVTMAPKTVGPAQTSAGNLRQVTVTDARGGTAGWSLTGKMTDLTATGGTIPAANMTWTPACAQTSGPAAGASLVQAAAAPLSNAGPVGLCSVTSGGPGGVFTADAALSLAIPAFQPAGTYGATLTLSLA